MGQWKGHQNDPEILTIGWEGLPGSSSASPKNWMRFEVVRHFEGIPWFENREIIGTRKPRPHQASVDAALKIPLMSDAGA